jgi:hypothetical protein
MLTDSLLAWQAGVDPEPYPEHTGTLLNIVQEVLLEYLHVLLTNFTLYDIDELL